jgi:hypothetical protein
VVWGSIIDPIMLLSMATILYDRDIKWLEDADRSRVNAIIFDCTRMVIRAHLDSNLFLNLEIGGSALPSLDHN